MFKTALEKIYRLDRAELLELSTRIMKVEDGRCASTTSKMTVAAKKLIIKIIRWQCEAKTLNIATALASDD